MRLEVVRPNVSSPSLRGRAPAERVASTIERTYVTTVARNHGKNILGFVHYHR